MNQSNKFTTQTEINEYKQRQQLAEIARLRAIKQTDRITWQEALGVFGVMILLTIVIPAMAGWLTR